VDDLKRLTSSSNQAWLREQIEEVVSAYLGDLDDPGEVDSEDLAENIVLQLERRFNDV
jgi:hypothetical protein